MSKPTFNKALAVIVQLAVLAAAGALLFYVWKLRLLPNRYALPLSGAVAVLAVLNCLLLRQPRQGKYQKQPKKLRMAAGYLLALVLIAGFCTGTYALHTLSNTLSSITNTGGTIQVLLEVYVRSDDPALYIQDTAGYRFAISDTTDDADNQAAIAELETLLGGTITTVRYNSALGMIDALYAGEVEAVILDTAYLTLLESFEGYTDYESKIRLLHEHVIEKVPEPAEVPVSSGDGTGSAEPVQKDPTNTPFLLYISGNDARRKLLANGGSDVNILVAVNPVDHQILMINTPRDYYVINPASGGTSRDKLSHCGLKGIDNTIQAITGLYGVPIDYYAKINFTGFRTLVDAMGGVTVYSPVTFSSGDYHFYKGNNTLNGAQALVFARDRKSLAGGDNARGKNQMRLIEGMIQKLTSTTTLLTNYSSILKSLEGMFATSMSPEEIAQLVQFQLSEMPNWEIFSFAVTGDNGNDFCWAAGGNGYVMYPHQNMVDKAVALMETVLSGETITQEDLAVK